MLSLQARRLWFDLVWAAQRPPTERPVTVCENANLSVAAWSSVSEIVVPTGVLRFAVTRASLLVRAQNRLDSDTAVSFGADGDPGGVPPPGGGTGAEIVIEPEALAVARPALALLTVTVLCPALVYVWVTEVPAAVVPSPKFQVVLSGDHTSNGLTLKFTGCPTTPELGIVTVLIAGAEYVAAWIRLFEVPDWSQSTIALP
jgi:hypothetical protein